MRSSTSTSIAFLALLASPAFAAPLGARSQSASPESRGIGSTIGSGLLGGAASAVGNAGVSGLIGEIESFFKRADVSARSLTVDQKAALHTALVNHFANKVAARGIGSTLGSGLLSGGASAVGNAGVSGLIGEIESFFKRDLEDRKIGSTIGSGLLSGGAAAVGNAGVSGLIGEIESFFKRDLEMRTVVEEPVVEPTPKAPSTGSTIGNGLLSGGAAAVGSTAVSGLIDEIKKFFRREIDNDVVARSLNADQKAALHSALVNHFANKVAARGVGSTIGSGLLSGGASAVGNAGVSGLIGEIESFFKRELNERTTAAPKPAAPEEEGSSIGSTIGTGLLSGAASGAVGNAGGLSDILHKIEGFFKRDLEDRKIGSTIGSGLLSGGAAAVGNAGVSGLIGEIESFFKRDLEDRKIGSTIGSGLLSGGAAAVGNAGVSGIIGEIESLFKRDEMSINDLD